MSRWEELILGISQTNTTNYMIFTAVCVTLEGQNHQTKSVGALAESEIFILTINYIDNIAVSITTNLRLEVPHLHGKVREIIHQVR